MNQEQQNGKGSFWLGLMIGGLVSVGLLVLLGSERGKKLLQKFQDEGIESLLGDAKDEVAEKVEQLKGKGEELLEQSNDLQKEVVDTVTEAKADISEAVAEKVDETLSHIEAIQEHGRQSTAELRKRLFKNIPKKA